MPAFAGQDMTEEALELARWTAMKDFIEQCWERKANGPVSDDCENAMAASLPPPPHMDFDKKMDKLVGRMSDSASPELRFDHTNVAERHSFGVIELSACVGMYVVLLLAWLYVQETFRRLRWRWSLSVPRRAYVSYDGMADEEIGEFSYDYVELRPEPIRPSTIANHLQSRTLEEMAHARLPDVSTEEDPSHMTENVANVTIESTSGLVTVTPRSGSRVSRSRSDEDSGEGAARHARQPTLTDEELVLNALRKNQVLVRARAAEREEAEREAAEKKRLSARFEVKPDDAASMRRRQNMAAQRNRRASIVSDKSTGSVARVRRDEYATSSSNAFGALEGLEELSDEDGPGINRSPDRGFELWEEGYVNHHPL